VEYRRLRRGSRKRDRAHFDDQRRNGNAKRIALATSHSTSEDQQRTQRRV
jgi:hypothetical protein